MVALSLALALTSAFAIGLSIGDSKGGAAHHPVAHLPASRASTSTTMKPKPVTTTTTTLAPTVDATPDTPAVYVGGSCGDRSVRLMVGPQNNQ